MEVVYTFHLIMELLGWQSIVHEIGGRFHYLPQDNIKLRSDLVFKSILHITLVQHGRQGILLEIGLLYPYHPLDNTKVHVGCCGLLEQSTPHPILVRLGHLEILLAIGMVYPYHQPDSIKLRFFILEISLYRRILG